MTDPITAAARATAERLAAEYGPGLAADVDAALHARGTAQRPGRYLDPVSVGSLIVAMPPSPGPSTPTSGKHPNPHPASWPAMCAPNSTNTAAPGKRPNHRDHLGQGMLDAGIRDQYAGPADVGGRSRRPLSYRAWPAGISPDTQTSPRIRPAALDLAGYAVPL
jgi:hypothetical protein